MEIKFANGMELTTEHPASHYGAGVLLDKDGSVYGPADLVAGSNDLAKKMFGVEIPLQTAGELMKSHARNNRLSPDALALIRRFVSQDPDAYPLEDDETLARWWDENDSGA